MSRGPCIDVYGVLKLFSDRCIINSLTISMETKAVLRVCQELAYLKSTSDFFQHFKPKYLLELYDVIGRGASAEVKRLANRTQKEMASACSRSTYVSLKWVIFHHQLLLNAFTPAAIQYATESLRKVPQPSVNAHFQEYLALKLLAPYKQYLIKLAEILMRNAQGMSPQKQRRSQENSDYCLFNLLAFALREFSVSMKEFSRFFQRFFPCLNDYIRLVGKDCSRMMKKLRDSYEEGALPTLTFLQVEQLDSQLILFNEQAARLANTWIFPQTNAVSLEIESIQEEIEVQAEAEKGLGRALQSINISNNR